MSGCYSQAIDFSSMHHVMIENEDGSRQPMDEPYFQPKKIAQGTWMCLTDGDYSYLVEGDDEALVIDSGYGCGNIRRFCQSLTEKPVRNIANTHYHFDHTANNCYFDCVFLSEETKKRATIPGPSFGNICFPRDYKTQIIEEGYLFRLGNRDLETISIPCHAEGALGFLDRRERLLFCGDEMYRNVSIHRSVRRFADNVEKMLSYRDGFDRFCCGEGVYDISLMDDALKCARYILDGHAQEGISLPPKRLTGSPAAENGQIVYKRREPRFHDTEAKPDLDFVFRRALCYNHYTITYDIRKIEGEQNEI